MMGSGERIRQFATEPVDIDVSRFGDNFDLDVRGQLSAKVILRISLNRDEVIALAAKLQGVTE